MICKQRLWQGGDCSSCQPESGMHVRRQKAVGGCANSLRVGSGTKEVEPNGKKMQPPNRRMWGPWGHSVTDAPRLRDVTAEQRSPSARLRWGLGSGDRRSRARPGSRLGSVSTYDIKSSSCRGQTRRPGRGTRGRAGRISRCTGHVVLPWRPLRLGL